MELTEIPSGGKGVGISGARQQDSGEESRKDTSPPPLWAKAAHSYLPSCKNHCLMTDQSERTEGHGLSGSEEQALDLEPCA